MILYEAEQCKAVCHCMILHGSVWVGYTLELLFIWYDMLMICHVGKGIRGIVWFSGTGGTVCNVTY